LRSDISGKSVSCHRHGPPRGRSCQSPRPPGSRSARSAQGRRHDAITRLRQFRPGDDGRSMASRASRGGTGPAAHVPSPNHETAGRSPAPCRTLLRVAARAQQAFELPRPRSPHTIPDLRGRSSMVELQLPKLLTWVRFPSPAPLPPRRRLRRQLGFQRTPMLRLICRKSSAGTCRSSWPLALGPASSAPTRCSSTLRIA
jgi:hypothetical protein